MVGHLRHARDTLAAWVTVWAFPKRSWRQLWADTPAGSLGLGALDYASVVRRRLPGQGKVGLAVRLWAILTVLRHGPNWLVWALVGPGVIPTTGTGPIRGGSGAACYCLLPSQRKSCVLQPEPFW